MTAIDSGRIFFLIFFISFLSAQNKFNHLKRKMAAVAVQSSDVPKMAELTELNPLPAFIEHRQTVWDKVKTQYKQELQAKNSSPITIRTFGKVNFFSLFFRR